MYWKTTKSHQSPTQAWILNTMPPCWTAFSEDFLWMTICWKRFFKSFTPFFFFFFQIFWCSEFLSLWSVIKGIFVHSLHSKFQRGFKLTSKEPWKQSFGNILFTKSYSICFVPLRGCRFFFFFLSLNSPLFCKPTSTLLNRCLLK